VSLHQQSDAEVLSSSIEDPEAFLPIFDRHFDRIAGYIARRTSVSWVEELVSEVFVRAFANRRQFDRSRADVLPWLYGIATNVLRENRRRERRELELLARMEAAASGRVGTEATNGDSPLAPRVASALLSLTSLAMP
jgi:DNA-directed RNA polymerase specialized sigma24 family protein